MVSKDSIVETLQNELITPENTPGWFVLGLKVGMLFQNYSTI